MRFIQRYEEPSILTQKKEEWTKKFIESGKPRPEQGNKQYGHDEVKTKLHAQSHTKCYYCEGLLKDGHKEIDHFVEITCDKTLAFEWTNLYLCCDHCNKKMRHNEISVQDVLNPCKDSDEEIAKHIYFEDEIISWHTPKGEQTIKKYKLGSEKMDGRRSRALREVRNALKKFYKGGVNKEDVQTLLLKLSKNNHQYSYMFECCLNDLKK